jgi:hypothetical protein
MVWVDSWSALFALILFVQLLAPMITAILYNNKKAKEAESEERPQQQLTADPGTVTL